MSLQDYLISDMHLDIIDSYDAESCPKCGSKSIFNQPFHNWQAIAGNCFDCGFEWDTTNPENVDLWISKLGNGAYA